MSAPLLGQWPTSENIDRYEVAIFWFDGSCYTENKAFATEREAVIYENKLLSRGYGRRGRSEIHRRHIRLVSELLSRRVEDSREGAEEALGE